MTITKISKVMRFFLLGVSSVIWPGVALTGLNTVHWVLYLPAVLLLFAALTGICPGFVFSSQLFPSANKRE